MPGKAIAAAIALNQRYDDGAIGWAPQLRELLTFATITKTLGIKAAAANLAAIAPEPTVPTCSPNCGTTSAPTSPRYASAHNANHPGSTPMPDPTQHLQPGNITTTPALGRSRLGGVEPRLDPPHSNPDRPHRPHRPGCTRRRRDRHPPAITQTWRGSRSTPSTSEPAPTSPIRAAPATNAPSPPATASSCTKPPTPYTPAGRFPSHTPPVVAEAAMLLEESRAEYRQRSRRRTDRRWLRHAVTTLITADDTPVDDPWHAGKLAGLLLARVDARILTIARRHRRPRRRHRASSADPDYGRCATCGGTAQQTTRR